MFLLLHWVESKNHQHLVNQKVNFHNEVRDLEGRKKLARCQAWSMVLNLSPLAHNLSPLATLDFKTLWPLEWMLESRKQSPRVHCPSTLFH